MTAGTSAAPPRRPRRDWAQLRRTFAYRFVAGSEVAAIHYSLIEPAKLNGLDAKKYLKRAMAAAPARF